MINIKKLNNIYKAYENKDSSNKAYKIIKKVLIPVELKKFFYNI